MFFDLLPKYFKYILKYIFHVKIQLFVTKSRIRIRIRIETNADPQHCEFEVRFGM